MLYAVFFEDDPAFSEMRMRLMPQPLDFLERNAERICAAGPLRNAADGSSAGGLWLVEAPDRASVVALYENDPFWPTGLRRKVTVCEWSQVFADGRRLR